MLPVGFPQYSVKFYRRRFYKLIRFKTPLIPHLPPKREAKSSLSADVKFSQAYSRARSVVLQLALCNDWDWFITCTIDQHKFDRYDLKSFYKAFSQWIRDQSKKYGCKIRYFFVPEFHKDGAVHLHGMISGIPLDCLCPFIPGLHPRFLTDNGYMNWPAYQKKFGYCSLGKIKDFVAAGFYICKYISKDLEMSPVGFGGHMYRASIGLNRALPLGYVYGRYGDLDARLDDDGQFCDVAFVRDVDWDFWLDFIPVDYELEPLEFPDPFEYSEEVFEVFTNIPLQQLSLFDS